MPLPLGNLIQDDLLNGADIRQIFEACSAESITENRTPICPPNGKREEELILTSSGRPVWIRIARQKFYIESIKKHGVTVAIGPAGTGKTFLAIAMAVSVLREKQVLRVILSRPTVEAGENLGYLPGDLLEKVDSHFTPLYDTLTEFLGVSRFQQLLRQGMLVRKIIRAYDHYSDNRGDTR